MSTLPGLAAKGEKGKLKYQSLDINNLYRQSRGESLEKQQQKSTVPLKHGMQTLGRVTHLRRGPANLPSLKSEHSGSDSAVSLVPTGGPGWAKQDAITSAATSQPTSSTVTITTSTAAGQQQQPSQPPRPATAPQATTSNQQPAASAAAAVAGSKQSSSVATPATSDKSWSSVMSGPPDHHLHHPPPYQSPQFHQEFPSLSAGDGSAGGGAHGGAAGGADVQYGPGPSLRPETEGSWTQGGSRAGVGGSTEGKGTSAPLGAPPQLSAQVGLGQQSVPPQLRVVMPQFMYRNSFPANGHSSNNNIQPTPQSGGRSRMETRPLLPRHLDGDEVAHRPIIKEEDLNRMDDIARDVGWATHDDIDYNQKLEFSDDDTLPDKDARKEKRGPPYKETEKTEVYSENVQNHQRSWSGGGRASGLSAMRSSRSDEDAWNYRRQQQSAEVAEAVERAKQRKEEEEKRFLEKNKQAAAKKLKELNEKVNKAKREKEEEGTTGTIAPSSVPPQPITPAPIPVPEWERERSKARTPNESGSGERKTPPPQASGQQSQLDFRQLTQIEGKIVRKDSRNTDRVTHDRERDRDLREQNGPSYQRHQADVPPRFQKLRNSGGVGGGTPSVFQHSSTYDPRWQIGNKSGPAGRKLEDEKDRVDERRDFRRQGSSDDGFRGTPSRSFSESSRKPDNRFNNDETRDFRTTSEYEYRNERDEDKWNNDNKNKRPDAVDDDWNIDRHDKYRDDKSHHPPNSSQQHHQQQQQPSQHQYDRPQRPDSRDSRASRDSRTSRDSNRDYEYEHGPSSSIWNEPQFESQFEEKKRDGLKEDRRQVPGPITKERMEAEEMRNEKRNLTQLKRGQLPDKKSLDSKKDEKFLDKDADNSWDIKRSNLDPKFRSDSMQSAETTSNKFIEDIEKSSKKYTSSVDSIKEEHLRESDPKTSDVGKDRDDKKGTPRSRSGWSGSGSGGSSGGYVYNRSWTKRGGKGPQSRSGPPGKGVYGKEWLGMTESEGSEGELSISTESGKDEKGKGAKKFEKEENNKDVKASGGSSDQLSQSERRQDRSENRRDNYVPRGEPSRHGRGGGYGGRRGGGSGSSMGKRLDGYGPPPSKSPFSHSEQKIAGEGGDVSGLGVEDKVKQNQMALSAGLSGRKDGQSSVAVNKSEGGIVKNLRRGNDGRKGKSKGKGGEEGVESTSENSDDGRSGRRVGGGRQGGNRMGVPGMQRRNIPRLSGEKGRGKDPIGPRQNSSGNLRQGIVKKDDMGKADEKTDEGNVLCNAIADITLKTKDEQEVEIEEKTSDMDGFQEVKSKKTMKDKPKPDDRQNSSTLGKSSTKSEKEFCKPERKNKATAQLTQQQISNIPPLMATPVNPPPVLPHTSKSSFGRSKESKLAPRFVKKKESYRQQLAQIQQQQGLCDVSEMSKVGQAIGMYGIKEQQGQCSMPMTSAWEKPLLRNTIEQEGVLSGVVLDSCKVGLEVAQSQSAGSPGGDKVIGKTAQLPDKSVLDGATPPVNTIIFENTNFKSAPGSARKPPVGGKLDDNLDPGSVITSFSKPMGELLAKQADKQDSLQIQLTFSSKEDTADMKLDFFESEISHLTEEKGSKNLGMARSMHTIASGNSTISSSTADALNFKIQSVKKVWETSMPTVIEHNVVPDGTESSFGTSFGGPDHSGLDPSGAFSKGTDTPDDNHEGYSPSPNQAAANSTTNVCKVKPTQQVPGTSGQAVLNSSAHQQHSGMVGPSLMGHQLSPPPMAPVIGAGVGLGQPPQQYTANQHIGYQVGSSLFQAGLGGSTQYGMSAIPSPPTVLFNATQPPLQAQTGLYAPFQMDQTGVIGGQGRSQYSQYPYNLGQTGSSPYSAQSMYLQTPQPHAPPQAAQAPPDLYQNLNSYRLSGAAPFAQSQQLNSSTTITSNSLMSASVKPSSQQIGAIGTKASGVGQAYQQQSQQGQQLYMTYDPATIQANYLQNTGVLQRGSAGPVQNNVVPAALQASSSFYAGSTGGQTGYFQQPSSSALQSAAQLQQHQATGYGLQGSVFGTHTHSQSHTSPSLQGFNSHFLSTPMQIAAAAALNAQQQQQYRSQSLQNTYLKSVGGQPMGGADQSGRNQQLKSPGGQQEVLSSVFNSTSQIPSPKSRQNCKQPPPQSSPTSQHKYSLYQGVSGQQGGQAQRYPAPIQRPVNFQPALSIQNSGSANNQKHRSNNSANKAPRQYYANQGSNLSSQNEKCEDKLVDGSNVVASTKTPKSSSNIGRKSPIGSNNSTAVNADIAKDVKEESAVIKD